MANFETYTREGIKTRLPNASGQWLKTRVHKKGEKWEWDYHHYKKRFFA